MMKLHKNNNSENIIERRYHSFIRDATVTCDCSTLTTPILFIDPASSNPNVRSRQLQSDACLL